MLMLNFQFVFPSVLIHIMLSLEVVSVGQMLTGQMLPRQIQMLTKKVLHRDICSTLHPPTITLSERQTDSHASLS